MLCWTNVKFFAAARFFVFIYFYFLPIHAKKSTLISAWLRFLMFCNYSDLNSEHLSSVNPHTYNKINGYFLYCLILYLSPYNICCEQYDARQTIGTIRQSSLFVRKKFNQFSFHKVGNQTNNRHSNALSKKTPKLFVLIKYLFQSFHLLFVEK